MHFIKLTVRSFILIGVLLLYILNRAWESKDTMLGKKTVDLIVLSCIFVMFVVEMGLRFFPSKMESMGSQKQFKKHYCPTDDAQNIKPNKLAWWRTLLVFGSWVLLNGGIAALYVCNIINKGVLLLVSLTYSVCDMICILFFCPFHELMMKNKCCTTCRIYNWDFPMMFTPLIFVMNFFTWGLVAVSFALVLEWEILYRVHPERFTENTNKSLQCANCQEKLCQYKTHIKKFVIYNLSKLTKKEAKEPSQAEAENDAAATDVTEE